MRYWLLHWLLSGVALLIVSAILPGIQVSGFGSGCIAALVIGLVSATLGLVLKIVLLPFIILSLGIVYFLINGPDTQSYCMIVIPALWRDTPGPTWQLVAAMFGTSSERLKKGRQHHRHSSVLSSTLDRLEFVLVERSDVPGPR